jgi:hypothetical protein
MMDLKKGDAVRVTGGAYYGWIGTITHISKAGVATVNITAIPGVEDLLSDPEDEIKAGVRLNHLERIGEEKAA